jgi:glucose/arabinose dehydrogenase/mono/diheme cytochrome c family protein
MTHASSFITFLAFVLAATAVPRAVAQNGDRPGDVQVPPAPHLKSPSAPALSAQDALRTFRLPPGFRIEVAAADPLVFDPVAMTMDADGRIWVVEMRAFMTNVDGMGESAPIGTVAVLDDTDGDGRMDKRTEFAAGLVLPRALAVVARGALVAEPPNLWFFEDTNGDGRADKRTQVASDYGNPANPEHTANGLLWALDNWIYSANHTVRFRYDRGKWRREQTVFRGQWGIAQDDVGRLVYNTNSDPLRMDVLPAEYLLRNPNLIAPDSVNVQLARAQDVPVWPGRITLGVNRGYRMLREDGTLPRITAACGPVIYRGTAFPREFHGNAFLAEPAANLVKRLVIEERDGVPIARNAYERTEFLTSTDERFRPVNLYNGPDGALYVVDMYRGIIQHRIYLTTYLRNQIQERGLEAPVGLGRIYRIVADGAGRSVRPALTKFTTPKLVAALAHREAWWRDTAQRLLVERQDVSAVSALRKLVLSSASELARLHALWTLDGLNAVDWESVSAGLADPDVAVAIAAARLAERFYASDPARVSKAFAARAAWGEPVFLRQLALSLGSAPGGAADETIVRLASEFGARPYMADAIVSSLAGREGAVLDRLTVSGGAGAKPVLSALTAAILESGDARAIEKVIARFGAGPASPGWLLDAILDGLDRFIPGDAGGQRTAFLPTEPAALIALSKQVSPQSERALVALKFLRWRGQSIDTSQPLAGLTAVEREQFERGGREFAVCAACHQANGEGMSGLAPPLVGSRWVTGGVGALARIVLNGKTTGEMTMPPLRALDDGTVAAILTFIRRSWGHESPVVTPAQVSAVRAEIANREEPWSESELKPMN